MNLTVDNISDIKRGGLIFVDFINIVKKIRQFEGLEEKDIKNYKTILVITKIVSVSFASLELAGRRSGMTAQELYVLKNIELGLRLAQIPYEIIALMEDKKNEKINDLELFEHGIILISDVFRQICELCAHKKRRYLQMTTDQLRNIGPIDLEECRHAAEYFENCSNAFGILRVCGELGIISKIGKK